MARRARAEHYAPHAILLKSRRIKATTEFVNEMMAMCCTEPYTEALIAAQTGPDAIKLLRMAHTIYDKLPPGIQPARRGENKAEFDFPALGSYFTTGTAGSLSLARGGGLNFGVDDEAAWSNKGIDDREQWYTGLREAFRRGILISQSTPRPVGWFRFKFMDAYAGKCPGIYPLVMTHWEDDETRVPLTRPDEAEEIYCTLTDEERVRAAGAGFNVSAPYPAEGPEVWERIKWRRLKWATLGRLAPQEYVEDVATCWVSLGVHFYDPDCLARHLAAAARHPPLREHEAGAVRIWEDHDPSCQYLIVTDAAEGGARGDQCVSELWNASHGRQAGEVWGRWRAHEFARMTDRYLGTPYGRPLWAIERGGAGYAVIEAARDNLGYDNLYCRMGDPDKLTGAPTMELGWDTNPVTRPAMLEKSREALELDQISVFSERLLGECSTFKLRDVEKQRYEAEKGTHDEGPITLAMAVYIMRSGAVAMPQVDWL